MIEFTHKNASKMRPLDPLIDRLFLQWIDRELAFWCFKGDKAFVGVAL